MHTTCSHSCRPSQNMLIFLHHHTVCSLDRTSSCIFSLSAPISFLLSASVDGIALGTHDEWVISSRSTHVVGMFQMFAASPFCPGTPCLGFHVLSPRKLSSHVKLCHAHGLCFLPESEPNEVEFPSQKGWSASLYS